MKSDRKINLNLVGGPQRLDRSAAFHDCQVGGWSPISFCGPLARGEQGASFSIIFPKHGPFDVLELFET